MKKIVKPLAIKILLLTLFFSQSIFVFGQGASGILLSPDFQEITLNEEFSVEILISSDEKLIGADVGINFDPDILEVVSVDDGDTFSNVALKAVDEGKVKITAIEETKGESFSGNGRLAILNLRAKDAADTTLEIDFEEGSTIDSNLTTAGVQDVLTQAQGGQYVIGTPIQRGTASVRRFVVNAVPYVAFLIFVSVAGFFGYRWWKNQQSSPKNIFEQRRVPMDKPPST